MIRNRAVQHSLTAPAVAVCVLSLASFASAGAMDSGAMDSGGGFSGLLLDQPRCCFPAEVGKSTVHGVEGPAAVWATGGRAAKPGSARPPEARGSREQTGRAAANPGGATPAAGMTGPSLAQDSEAPPPEPPRKKPANNEQPRSGKQAPKTAPGDGSGAFGGNPKPAGPDLTVNEERELISRGWD